MSNIITGIVVSSLVGWLVAKVECVIRDSVGCEVLKVISQH